MIRFPRLCFLVVGICVMVGLAMMPQSALAKPAERIPLEVVDQSEDLVGRLYVANFKEKIAQSDHFRLTQDKEPRLRIIISTIDKYEDDPNKVTIYSVTWTFASKSSASLFLTSTLGYCGVTKVDVSTNRLLRSTERLMRSLDKIVQDQRNIPES